MGSRGTRLAALLIAGAGALGMVGAMSGVAQASVVLNHVAGPFPDQASCDASQAAARSAPDAVVAGCTHYLTADYAVHITAPGWYYRYAISGR